MTNILFQNLGKRAFFWTLFNGVQINIWFDPFRVEFVDINYITKMYRGKIDEMKKNFARVNETFHIGIDGADGKWSYTPTDKYTHVMRYFSCFVSL